MTFQVKEPVLVIGLGGVGSKLAESAKEALNADCMTISNDSSDLGSMSIHVSTGPVINPSIQLIRGAAFEVADKIRDEISKHSTVIMMSNLAGKAGAAIAPVVSQICKKSDTGLFTFAIMPFKYEKDRIFNSGISLKRVRKDSECTVVLDNDALLESNPDLSAKSCYDIANSAIMHVVKSLGTLEIEKDTNVISASKHGQEIKDSLRDSLKMLYENAPPNSVKSSILCVVGGSNIPVGVLKSITSITNGIVESKPQIDMTSKESNIVMLSSVQGMTKFDSYDPLGVISEKDTLDWSTPECSMDCKMDLYQME